MKIIEDLDLGYLLKVIIPIRVILSIAEIEYFISNFYKIHPEFPK